MTIMPTSEPFDPLSIAGFSLPPVQPVQPTGLTTFGGFNVPSAGQNFFSGLQNPGGIGLNMPTFNLALGGLQTIGGLWAAKRAADIAKKQLAFSKGMANANLANATQSYNTALADRARSRGAVEGQSQAQVNDYITQNSLQKRTIG